MDFEPTPPRSPILLPMTLNIPGVTGRNYTILTLKRIAQARIAAREEREESGHPTPFQNATPRFRSRSALCEINYPQPKARLGSAGESG